MLQSSCICSSNKRLKGKKQCQVHGFSLKNQCSYSKTNMKANVNFCPVTDKFTKTKQNIYPHFNGDGKPHLPAFTLETDDVIQGRIQSFYVTNQQKYFCDHKRKISTSQVHNLEVSYEPEPRNQTRYCSVCQSNYKNYSVHVQQNKHKNNILSNKFNDYIKDMCLIYEQYHSQCLEYVKNMEENKINLTQSLTTFQYSLPIAQN